VKLTVFVVLLALFGPALLALILGPPLHHGNYLKVFLHLGAITFGPSVIAILIVVLQEKKAKKKLEIWMKRKRLGRLSCDADSDFHSCESETAED